ncbi:glycosyltransferase family 2 protein [Salipiger abyssi]|uniref:glycosyltransferase family 2 protein n=1 Tax=Salipiger abyssi TaxID=1250539 RepID=UPI001A8D9D4B|nr:glycosyltransferase family 2 protein [Salipiger abyssi]MBN9886271.1 glycosyltransferase family 2 protein [Salipiger abyssi]
MTISVIMANYCGAEFLGAAIASVLRQTHADLELIVADDASTDDSVAIVRDWAARDPRVRLLEAQRNGGAAAARNRCIDAARGEWIAIADSDDIMHPDRLRRLLAAAEDSGAPIVCDDMVFVSDSPLAAGRTLLETLALCEPYEITAEALIASDLPDSAQPPLGYLKPLIARHAISDLRYDESLQISEDFDFYLRLLRAGHRAIALPDPMYLYRRHAQSLSYRLSADAVARMIAAHERIAADADRTLIPVLTRRSAALKHQLAFENLVEALKSRQMIAAAGALLRRPTLMRNLARSVAERRKRQRATPLQKTELRLCLGKADRPGCGKHIAFPAVPAAGGQWPVPPAPIAAQLTDLAARHHLSVEAEGAEGLWALWLLPIWRNARLRLEGDAAEGLPIPDGVERRRPGTTQ